MGAKFLIIPDEGAEDVAALAGLSAEQITQLDSVLSDKSSLKRGSRIFQLIAERLSVGQDVALKLWSAITNIRLQRERFGMTDADLVSDIHAVARVGAEAERDEALRKLFQRSDEDRFVEKVGALRHALLPHMVEARTVVETRPIFSKDRLKIDGMLLLTVLDVTCHDHVTGDTKSMTMQLSRKNIVTLRERLDDAEKKLTLLEGSIPGMEFFE